MPGKFKISLVTLGCAKNLVDSEYLAKQLEVNGFTVKHESPGFDDVVIVNTCGFINDAKQESIDTILHYIEAKKLGKIQRLYVMGCLSQRYKTALEKEIPEVDAFFGVEDQRAILQHLNATLNSKSLKERKLATPNHYAYLKIAEGCNRKCSFCSIPLIRGNYKSKSIEELQQEASFLAEMNTKEINLIAQDLSFYGYDLYNTFALPGLLDNLAQMDLFTWIRLLYFYPHHFPTPVLDMMKQHKSICNYLDIPFQHISDKMLKKMRRGIDKQKTYELIELIFNSLPKVTLRTTLLVGHPGETEKDFDELLHFVEQVEFDRLGVFTYSEEEDTYSAIHYNDKLPESVKKERADEIMRLQQSISLRKNKSFIDSTLLTLIDREDDDYYYGRTEADAPEVDNEVIISKNGEPLKIGEFYPVQITGASEYDLYGRLDK